MALTRATVGGKITAAIFNAVIDLVEASTPGLKRVVPTSVAGSGVSFDNETGLVTFSASTSVSLNGCFTSSFRNYLIIANVTAKSAESNVQMRMRLSGTDASGATDYTYQRTFSNAATVTTARVVSNFWELEAGVLATADIEAKVFSPMLAERTRINSLAVSSTDLSIYTSTVGGRHLQSTAYDGMSLVPTSGNMTGTLKVYGYN